MSQSINQSKRTPATYAYSEETACVHGEEKPTSLIPSLMCLLHLCTAPVAWLVHQLCGPLPVFFVFFLILVGGSQLLTE